MTHPSQCLLCMMCPCLTFDTLYDTWICTRWGGGGATLRSQGINVSTQQVVDTGRETGLSTQAEPSPESTCSILKHEKCSTAQNIIRLNSNKPLSFK